MSINHYRGTIGYKMIGIILCLIVVLLLGCLAFGILLTAGIEMILDGIKSRNFMEILIGIGALCLALLIVSLILLGFQI